MMSTSLTRNSFCFYQFHFHQHLTIPSSSSPPSKAHFTKTSFFTLCNKNLVLNKKHRANKNRTFFKPHYTFLQELLYDSNPLHGNIKRLGIINRAVILINMWWAGLKANLGQRINLEAIVCSATVFTKEQHLAMPHVSVPDIRYIDWAELSRIGFKGVVFDKDNTITAPYSLSLWGPLRSSLDECKSVFGDDIAIFSNSSGLCEYDPDYSKARTLENAIGIKVLRHRVKKPAGTAEEIEEHFGCESSKLIMVGDRPFTDIVFGNRNGFLTILTEPLTLAREPFIVKQVRRLESFLLDRWFKKGLRPTSHTLLPDVQQCVKEPPSL